MELGPNISFTVLGMHIDGTALSIAGSAIAWFVQHWRDKKKEKIQKTVELLLPFTTSSHLADGNVLMAHLIAAGTPPTYGQDPEVDRKLIDLLDYYEFLCDLLERDVLDDDTVLSLRGNLLGTTFNLCKPYIEDLRTRHGRGVYESIEKVVQKHALGIKRNT